jgi:protein O-mannosyl-transferase
VDLPISNSTRTWLLPITLVLLAAIIPFVPTLGHELVLDDVFLMAHVDRLDREGGIGRVLTADFRLLPTKPLGYYRPIVLLSLWTDARLSILLPAGYYATNILLHTANAVLVFLLCQALLKSSTAALLAGLLFAVHPIHTESVAMIAGRTDLLATMFILLSTLVWARSLGRGSSTPAWILVISGLTVALGALSKEVGFVAPIALVILHVIHLRDRHVWREVMAETSPWLIAWACGFFLAIVIRWLVVDVAISTPASAERATIGLMVGVWARYLRMLLVPWPLNAFYMPGQVALDMVTGAAALALLLLASALSSRLSKRIGLLALVWIVVFLLPVSGIRPLLASVFAERFLYLPSVGFCLLAGFAIQRLGAATLIFIAASISMIRVGDWRDPLSFYSTLVRTSPTYAGAYEGLGQQLERLGRRNEAMTAYSEALRLASGRASTYNSIGVLFANEEKFSEAVGLFREAVRLEPDFSEARLNLAVACIPLGDRVCVSEQLEALRRSDRVAAARLQSVLDVMKQQDKY